MSSPSFEELKKQENIEQELNDWLARKDIDDAVLDDEELLKKAYQVRNSLEYDEILNYLWGNGQKPILSIEYQNQIEELSDHHIDFTNIDYLAIYYEIHQQKSRKK